MKKLYLFVILLFLFKNVAWSQKLLWDVDFDFKFDNREYLESDVANSLTLYGAFIEPKIGIGWDRHSLFIGGNLGRDFGAKSGLYNAELLFYYNYNAPKCKFNVGIFPTRERIGNYNHAFFSDNERFYDTSTEGFQAVYDYNANYAELIFDWVGKTSIQEKNIRERFRIYGSAQYNLRFFKTGFNFNMLHFAGSENVKGVVDNVLVYPYLGFELESYIKVMKLGLSFGWLQGFQNDRINQAGYVYPNGGILDFNMEYYGFGVDNSYFFGDNMMPYYNTLDPSGLAYGDKLYSGELFYATETGHYDRLELYWGHEWAKTIALKIGFVFHFDGKGYSGCQQMATLSVNMDNKLWAKLKNRFVK